MLKILDEKLLAPNIKNFKFNKQKFNQNKDVINGIYHNAVVFH